MCHQCVATVPRQMSPLYLAGRAAVDALVGDATGETP